MMVIERGVGDAAGVPDTQVVITQAKTRARRRRRRAATALLLMTGLLAGAGAALGHTGHRTPAAGATAFPVLPPGAIAPMPRFYVAHAQGGQGPGRLVVLDSRTGRQIRTLGSTYEPYPRNGFQLSPNGQSLYYVRLNEPAQTVEIVDQPVSGGPAVVIADGIAQTPSPDGSQLAYLPMGKANPPPGGPAGPIAVRNLRTSTIRTVTPPAGQHASSVTMAWLSNTTLLVVVSTNSAGQDCYNQFGAPGFTPRCPAITPATSSAFTLDVRTGRWTALPALPGHAWAAITAILPGSSPTHVRAITGPLIIGPRLQDTTGGNDVITLDLTTATITTRTPLPRATTYLGADRTGTRLILGTTTSTLTWTPDHPSPPHPLGPAWAEATWS